jgi:hypothetical protein
MSILDEIVLWKPLKAVSLMIYTIVILLIPISQFWSVIILFALICLWSRLPCLVSMFTKDLDVIDFFVVMLAINIGGLFAGIFGLIIMLFSRIFGPHEYFLYTVKDSISLLICGCLTPAIYAGLGSMLYTFYAFTIIRYILYVILTLIIEPENIALELGLCLMDLPKVYLYNTFIMSSFEGLLMTVFEGGVHFSLGLFLFATGIVGFFFFLGKIGGLFENIFPKQEPVLFVK